MHSGMTSCHDTLPQPLELVSFREFSHRLDGINLHALIARVRAGRFPPPALWRGRAGQAWWRRGDVDAALGARVVEVYDGEEVGPLGDP